jgi:uncharacterized protein (DUF3084 family)
MGRKENKMFKWFMCLLVLSTALTAAEAPTAEEELAALKVEVSALQQQVKEYKKRESYLEKKEKRLKQEENTRERDNKEIIRRTKILETREMDTIEKARAIVKDKKKRADAERTAARRAAKAKYGLKKKR